MKKTGLMLVLVSALAWAQQPQGAVPLGQIPAPPETPATSATYPVARLQTPTYSDRYCAGFIAKDLLPGQNFVAGGLNTPHTTKFTSNDIIYIDGGGLQAGQELTLVRELRDPNRHESFNGQRKLIGQAGHPYAELGHAKVLDTRQKMAIAEVSFSCEPVVPGDQAISFVERAPVPVRPPAAFDRFAPANGKLTGRLLLARDFDTVLGTGRKVYLSVGATQGVKVGDYFRIFRTYDEDLHVPIDATSFKASTVEDTQQNPPNMKTGFVLDNNVGYKSRGPKINISDLPRRSMGELVVLNVSPASATGMIVFSLEDIHVGDGVELEAENPAPATAAQASGAK